VGVEVPVWLEARELADFAEVFGGPGPLTGHIDLVREKGGAIEVWDYKPHARRERHAATQVFLYTFMLSVQPKLGKKLLTEITLKDLEDLRTKLAKKLQPQTIAHVFKLLKAMYNKSVLWNYFAGKNPVTGLKSKPLNNSRVRYLTQSIKMTERYAHLCPDVQATAVAGMLKEFGV